MIAAVVDALEGVDKSPISLWKKKFSQKSSTHTPTGKIILDGDHWDGTRLVKRYKGSKRPEHILSDFWKMLSPNERAKLASEEEGKATGSGCSASGSATKGSTKKPKPATTAKRLWVNPSPSGEQVTNVWEVIPEDRPKFCVPAMPKKASPAKAELHRPELRELIKNNIKELEFKVALELFSAVARLVPKDEIRPNPKAKAALDKEWENLCHCACYFQPFCFHITAKFTESESEL